MDNLLNGQIIDKDSAIPLYFQLYSYIRKAIDDGKIGDGEHLPTEDELVTALRISRPTIRQAYKELADKGYIKRRRSKGTIVTKPKVFDKFLSELTSFRNELEARGITQTKVLEFNIVENDDAISNVLKCDKYVHLRRVRYCDNIPIVYMDSYLPYEKYKEIYEYDMEEESMYSVMKRLGNPVVSVRRLLNAGMPKRKVAEYLQISTRTPTVVTKTIGKDADGEAVEYSIAIYNGEKATFQIDLQLKDII